jgi:hypothetical protein
MLSKERAGSAAGARRDDGALQQNHASGLPRGQLPGYGCAHDAAADHHEIRVGGTFSIHPNPPL